MRYRELVLPGLFWASVAYDMAVVSFTTKGIKEILALNNNPSANFLIGLLTSITLIGWFFGSLVFGYLSDKIGRRKIVIVALPLHVLATASMYLANSYIFFFLLRLLAGVGFGMILPTLSALVSEKAPNNIRGRMVVLLDSFWTYGWILASFTSIFITLPSGWEWYYLTSLFWLLLLPLSKNLPETVSSRRRKVPVREVLKYRHTYVIWTVWFIMAMSYYGIFTWLPTIMEKTYPVVKSHIFVFTTYLFQIPGYFLAAYLIEKIGRRYVLFLFMLLTALAAYLFLSGIIFIGATMLSFFDLGAWGALYAVTPELYPSRIKGTGSGAANSVGRIGGLIGPLMRVLFNDVGLFLLFTFSLLIGALSSLLLPSKRQEKN